MSKFKEIWENIKGLWQDNLTQGVDDESSVYARRERIIVFSVAFFLALGLWFLVNMSRNYSLDIQMPIELGNIPEERALATDLPGAVTVSLQGEGWKLVSLYNNPPRIFLNVTRDQVNLYEQVRDQLNALPSLTVLKVSPVNVEVELEDRVRKKVPVMSKVNVEFKEQFDFMNPPALLPDSVVISGAASQLKKLDTVSTETIRLNGISNDIDRIVALQRPHPLVELSRYKVRYQAAVAEFTEGETSVYVEANNVPADKNVTFSPPTVTIRYNVPIEQYKQTSEQKPFKAYVNYQQIRMDSTGYVRPNVNVTNSDLSVKIRSFQPDQLSYYHVLGVN